MKAEYPESKLIVISDLHIGNPSSLASRRLVEFLNWVEDQECRLCINGDGVDISQVSFAKISRELPEVLDALRRISRRTGPVYYTIGNHDIRLMHFLSDWNVVEVVPFLNIRSLGRRIRVEHGHLYDPFYIGFPQFYRFVTWFAGRLLAISPRFYRMWINYEKIRNRVLARTQDQVALKNEHPAFANAARMLLNRGFEGVIFGHTHVPGIMTIDADKIYANAGSWMDRGSYILIHNGEVTLHSWE